MPIGRATPNSIDDYIALFSPDVQAILERIRLTIKVKQNLSKAAAKRMK